MICSNTNAFAASYNLGDESVQSHISSSTNLGTLSYWYSNTDIISHWKTPRKIYVSNLSSNSSFDQSINSVLMTVPGIGAVNAACILGEIGDIKRFSKPCKLLAYAGLDPTVRQSGQFTAKSTRMSKRGSALLRYALINSAWQLTLNDTTFKAYYDLKRSQGLNHYGALGHVAHKLTRVIFKLLTSDTPFNPAKLVA